MGLRQSIAKPSRDRVAASKPVKHPGGSLRFNNCRNATRLNVKEDIVLVDQANFRDRITVAVNRALTDRSVDDSRALPIPPGNCAVPTPIQHVARCLLALVMQADVPGVYVVPDKDYLTVCTSLLVTETALATIPTGLTSRLTLCFRRMTDIEGAAAEWEGTIPVHGDGQQTNIRVSCSTTAQGSLLILKIESSN